MTKQWQTVKFGEVVRLVRETAANPLDAGLERYVGLEHLEPENLHVQSWGLVAEGTSFTQVFRAGLVLFGKWLGLSVKAYVLEPEFEPLFTEEERAIARQRLVDYGYKLE